MDQYFTIVSQKEQKWKWIQKLILLSKYELFSAILNHSISRKTVSQSFKLFLLLIFLQKNIFRFSWTSNLGDIEKFASALKEQLIFYDNEEQCSILKRRMFEKQKGKPRMLSKIASSAQITWSPSVCSFLSTRCHPLSSEKMFPFLSHAKWNKNTLYRWNNRGGKPPCCLAFFCRVHLLVAFRHNTSREICSSKMPRRVEWVGWLECFAQSGCVKRRGDVGTSRRMAAPYCFWCFRHQVWGLFLLLRITKTHPSAADAVA